MNARVFIMLFAMLGAASADVILPEEHTVEHRLYINNLDDYDEYEFFIYPTHMTKNVSEGSAFFTSSEVPRAYKFALPRLYAVKKTDMENRSIEEYFEDALKSDIGLGRISSLPNSDPRTSIETYYNISIHEGELTLLEILERDECEAQHECPEPEPDYVFPMLTLGVGLLVGYLVRKKA